MKKHSKPIQSLIITLWSLLALVGLGGTSVLADVVIEPRTGGQNTTWYTEIAGNWANSSVSASISPATGGIGCRYQTATTVSFKLTPTLVSGHTYALAHALPTGATSSSASLVLGITATDCTGLPATTDVFQYHGVPAVDLNVWKSVGTLTASTANPTITFSYSSGSASRTSVAAFWFKDLACQTPAVGAIDGPLTNGQTVVNVSGCIFNATAVYVYTNNDGTHATCIGTNSAPGGNTTVPVTVYPLVRGTRLQATQKVACENQPPSGSTGPLVGAGTNGPIRLCFDLVQTGTPGSFIWLTASGGQAGYQNPPIGASLINPSVGWQTLTVTPGTDPAWMWNNTPAVYALPNSGTATNISIWFTEDVTSETGPYTVYLDNLRNGDTLVKGWEGDPVGDSTFMQAPGVAMGTGTSALDNAPNATLCVSSNAAVGTECQRMDWQWVNPGPNAVRAMGFIAARPIFDLSKPISVDVLVLPAGATVPALQLSQPANIILSNNFAASTAKVTATENSTAHYGATSVTLSYQWQHNGANIDAGNAGDRTGYTSDTLGFTAPVAADAGTYTCVVTDTVGDGTYPGTYTLKASLVATYTDPIPVITTQPIPKVIATVGSTANLMTVGASPLWPAGNPLSYQWQWNGTDASGQTTSALSFPSGVQVADAGTYTVIVANAFLTAGVTSTVAILDVVQPGVVVGTGTGLRAEYYTLQTNGINQFVGAPTISTTNATINFDWLTGSPAPAISADYFTARWYGQVEALDTDTYTFYTRTDDGARLWVNGQELVNKWVLQGPTEHSGTIALAANTKYPIMMEYFEQTGGAVAQLSWSGAGGGVVKEIVPMSQLYPAASLPQPELSFGTSESTNLLFNWTVGSYSLTWATNVTGPYTNILYTGVGPYTYTNAFGPQPEKFFRLQSQ